MDIDGIPTSEFFSCNELPARLPQRDGKPPCKSTIDRWRRIGRKVGDKVVKLRACQIGGLGYFTCEAWVNQFFEAQQPKPPDEGGYRTVHLEEISAGYHESMES